MVNLTINDYGTLYSIVVGSVSLFFLIRKVLKDRPNVKILGKWNTNEIVVLMGDEKKDMPKITEFDINVINKGNEAVKITEFGIDGKSINKIDHVLIRENPYSVRLGTSDLPEDKFRIYVEDVEGKKYYSDYYNTEGAPKSDY